jgi:hypothetical protein
MDRTIKLTVLALLSASVILAGCSMLGTGGSSKKGSTYGSITPSGNVACESNDDCSSGQECSSETSTCVSACATSDDCLSNEECVLGQCEQIADTDPVVCTNNADCAATPAKPKCKTSTGACVACLVLADCGGSGFSSCNNNVCVPIVGGGGCTADATCLAADPDKPKCRISDGVCVECLLPANCDLGSTCQSNACAAIAKFTYQTDNGWASLLNSTYSMANVKGVVSGDFNKDGKTDIAVLHYLSGFFRVLVLKSNGTSFIAPTVWWNNAGSIPFVANYLYTMLSGDVNGDGKSDIIILWSSVSVPSYTVRVLLNSGTAFTESPGYSTTVNLIGDEPLQILVGDYNGDLKADLAFVRKHVDFGGMGGGLNLEQLKIDVMTGGTGSFNAKTQWREEDLDHDQVAVGALSGKFLGDDNMDDVGVITMGGLINTSKLLLYRSQAPTPLFAAGVIDTFGGIGYADYSSHVGSRLTSGDVNRDGKAEAIAIYGDGLTTKINPMKLATTIEMFSI